jgi:hypothetical protein
MKRALLILAALLLFPFGALTETFGDYTYVLAEDGVVITNYESDDAPQTLILPSSIGGHTVVSIGENALNNSEGAWDGEKVSALILPSTLKRVEEEAFQCCHDVGTIVFPASIEVIPEGCFSHVTAQMLVDAKNPWYYVQDGYLFDRRTETLLYSPWLEKETEVTLPNVKRIGTGALENLCGATGFVLPDTLESIGSYAFFTCYNIVELSIPDSVTVLDEGALSIESLQHVHLPKNLSEIPAYCFYDSNLQEIDIPQGVTSIGEFAFQCAGFTSVTLPASVTFVGYGAFDIDDITCLNPNVHFETEEELNQRIQNQGDVLRGNK